MSEIKKPEWKEIFYKKREREFNVTDDWFLADGDFVRIIHHFLLDDMNKGEAKDQIHEFFELTLFGIRFEYDWSTPTWLIKMLPEDISPSDKEVERRWYRKTFITLFEDLCSVEYYIFRDGRLLEHHLIVYRRGD